MQKKVKVKKIYATREGESEHGKWAFTSVEIGWEEESSNGSFSQSLVCDMKGKPNQNLLMAFANGEVINARIYMNSRQAKDGNRAFNDIKVMFDEEFMKEIAPS